MHPLTSLALLLAALLALVSGFNLLVPAGRGPPRTRTTLRAKEAPEDDASEDLSAAPVKLLANMDEYKAALAEHPDSVVVVKFYAKFCMACKAFDKKYRRMALQYGVEPEGGGAPPVSFFDMDWAPNRELAKMLDITKLPHVDMYAGGRGRVENFTCGPSKAGQVIEKLDKYITLPAPNTNDVLSSRKAVPDFAADGEQKNDNAGWDL